MRLDGDFWLRFAFGLFGLVVAGWILATEPPGNYLRLPSVVGGIASLYVLTSAFVPALRWPRR